MPLTLKTLTKRLVKIFVWLLGGVIVLLIVLVILIQVPAVQEFAKQKAVVYLQKKLRTRVEIGRLRIIFPKQILLEGVYFGDQRQDTLLSGRRIAINISLFRLLHKEIDVSNIDLEGVRANVYRLRSDTVFNYAYILKAFAGAPDTTHNTDTSAGFTFHVSRVVLRDITATYRDELSGIDTHLHLGNLGAEPDTIDPTHNIFTLSGLRIDSTDLRYDDTAARVARGIDYHHLGVSGFHFQADHIHIGPDAYSLHIAGISLLEKSGLHLKTFTATLAYSGKEAHIKGLDIQTDHSEIRNQTDAFYPSIDTLSKHLGLLTLDTRMDRCVIAIPDVLLFAPSLASQLKGVTAPLTLDGQIRGRVDALEIPGLAVAGLKGTALSLKGSIKGLPDATKALYDLTILRLRTGRADIAVLVPAKAIPANIHIPENLSATGTFKGTISVFQTLLDARTSNGNAWVKGSMNLGAKSYAGNIRLDQLDLGYILGQTGNLGKISLQATARGQGFNYPALSTDVQANLSDGMIKGYDYRGLVLNAAFHQGQGQVHAQVQDPEIAFALDAKGVVTKGSAYPSVHGTLRIDTADLHALHLMTDTLQLKGTANIDFDNTNPDALQGTLQLLHWTVNRDGQRLNADSIALVASHPGDSQYIHLWSDGALVDMDGVYRLTQVPGAMEQLINHYYKLDTTAVAHVTHTTHTTRADTAEAQSWTAHVLITPSPLLLTFVPQLKGSDTLGLHASFNSAQQDFRLSLRAPKLFYGADTVHQLDAEIATRNNELDYRVQTHNAEIGSYPLNQANITGHLANNKLYATVTLKDAAGKDWYRVVATATPAWTVSLNPDSLLLNHSAWQVSADNSIHYDSTGIVAHDFQISRQGQSLAINSVTPDPKAPIQVTFKDFHIGSVTAAAGQDSLPVDGVINGDAQLTQVLTSPLFTSNLTVKDVSYMKDTVGDLTLKVNNAEAGAYAADISLEGHQSDVHVTGKYYTGDSRLDMQLHLGALNLAAAKPFAAGQLDDIRGTLKGDIHITGTATHPVPDGDLHFVDARIVPNITGEPLRLADDNIEFDNTGFNFSKFAIQDSAGDKATVDGNVYTTDFRDYKFDLTFNADNFRLVNAPLAPDRMFYGKLNIDAAVNLEGDPESPKVDGDMRVNRKTDFVFVLPESDPEVVSRNGVVRFVDKDHPGDTITEKLALDPLSSVAPMKGMNISANISTDSSANFTVIIDQRNGDALKVRGRSSLNFGMDESGKTTLTGNYEINAGSYSLTLDVLKRTFLIQRGSRITWTGDPTAAQLDLTALYLANTAPIDLVEDQLAGSASTTLNRFKQKLPFTVSLIMKGEMLKPIITFDISLPNPLLLQWPEVDAKLQQIRTDPSELNKQVFALLLLGRFVGDNPLESEGGSTTAAQMAFQSASQILAGELNQLAGSLIKGVDVSFDLNNTQDYSTGQQVNQTDLGVTVSKGLFNDRIKVNVGSDFELAGTLPGQNASNIGGDLSVDYQLTKDGRYMIRAYRKNQYDVVVEGEVIETGLSFILTLDYNKFTEIFGKYFQSKLQARKTAHGS